VTVELQEDRRILIVDDNAAIHEDFRKVLQISEPVNAGIDELEKSLFGKKVSSDETAEVLTAYEMHFAHQGQEALQKVERLKAEGKDLSLVFMDMRMPPGWDGLETIERIWKVAPETEIVICSAYTDYSWADLRKRLGVTDRLLVLKKPFDPVEVQQLALALTKKWSLGRKVRSHIETLEKQVQERTVAVTAAMQSTFLPKVPQFKYDGLNGVGHYQPALLCGGDWWWHEVLPNTKPVVLLGDVTGHGPSAAMVTAAVASSFLTLKEDSPTGDLDFQKVLERINAVLFRLCGGSFLMTLSALEIDLKQNILTLWNSGGPPLLVKPSSGAVRCLIAQGDPLGLRREVKVGKLTTPFAVGDRCLAFTDGLSDIKGEGGRSIGTRGVMAMLERLNEKNAEDAKKNLIAQVDELRSSHGLEDDLTFTLIDRV
jgi:CheY-like chemotaxis protein